MNGAESIAEFIWRTRYRANGETSIQDTWGRVASAVAAVDADPASSASDFLDILSSYRFIPGGRILAGAGTSQAVTLANCFVMGPIDDSIVGVFDALRDAALTLQQGGGIGFDFSTLRWRGAMARGVPGLASGPVPVIRIFDATCAAVGVSNQRRGAMMATLRCDHPDIEAFVDAKRLPGSLANCNLSVLVTDAFMRAVHAGDAWPLTFPLRTADHKQAGEAQVVRTVAARGLWERICTAAHAGGEPGLLFIDRINEQNNLGYRETLTATNPCGEAPLPPYGACHLGSINLPRFVVQPFTANARLDLRALADTAALAVRFLDHVIDIGRYPLFRQATTARASRRLGLGVTGLADALAMLGQRYDSPDGRRLAAQALGCIRDAAYLASTQLARQHGSFPEFEREKYLDRPFVRSLPTEIRTTIARHGIRNSHLLAIAPAGSISLLAGNVSSGIEPIASLATIRHIALDDTRSVSFSAPDYAYQCWRDQHAPGSELPPALTLAPPTGHAAQLDMQAVLQPLVDGAISKTVAIDPQATAADVSAILSRAYELGLKGVTVYRQCSRTARATVGASHAAASTILNPSASSGCSSARS